MEAPHSRAAETSSGPARTAESAESADTADTARAAVTAEPGGLPGATVTVDSPERMHALGRALAALLRPGDLVMLSGELGAGKTTLARGLGEGLGVRGAVTSPTFVIARVHPSLVGGPALVHVDAYRLGGGLDEMEDLDLDVSLPDSVVVVEWGDGKVEELSDDRLRVVIHRVVGGDGTGKRDPRQRDPEHGAPEHGDAEHEDAEYGDAGYGDAGYGDAGYGVPERQAPERGAQEQGAGDAEYDDRRTVTLTGYGSRWSKTDFGALARWVY